MASKKPIPLIHLSPRRLSNSLQLCLSPNRIRLRSLYPSHWKATCSPVCLCGRVQSGHVSSVSFPSILPHALKGPRFVPHLVQWVTVFLARFISLPLPKSVPPLSSFLTVLSQRLRPPEVITVVTGFCGSLLSCLVCQLVPSYPYERLVGASEVGNHWLD